MTPIFIRFVKNRAGDDQASTSAVNLPELQAKTQMLKSKVESQLKYFVEESLIRGNGPSDPSLKLQFTSPVDAPISGPREAHSRTLSVFKNELNDLRFLLDDTAASTPTYTLEQFEEFKSLVSPDESFKWQKLISCAGKKCKLLL